MKKLISLTATVFLLLLLKAVSLFAQPFISFDGESFDFGDVGKGETLEHLFTFINSGTETLSIERVSSS